MRLHATIGDGPTVRRYQVVDGSNTGVDLTGVTGIVWTAVGRTSGRTITAETALELAVEEGAPDKPVVILSVPGVRVEADDRDGAGLARALSTLAAMVPG